MAGDIV